MAKPILKWAGGKTQLLQHLSPLIPKKIDTYFEPFFGGGAVFFNLKPKKYLISDINPELINLYKVLATSPSEIISELEKYGYLKTELNFEKILNSIEIILKDKNTSFNKMKINYEEEFDDTTGLMIQIIEKYNQ